MVHHLTRHKSALLRSAVRGHVCGRCTDEHGQSLTGCAMVLLLLLERSLPTLRIGQEEPGRAPEDDARLLV